MHVKFVKHNDRNMQILRAQIALSKFETWTENNFKLACIIGNFLGNAQKYLNECAADIKKFKQYKDYFKNYKFYIDKDSTFLKEKYGDNFKEFIFKEYLNKNISLVLPLMFLHEFEPSTRIETMIYEKFKCLEFYIKLN